MATPMQVRDFREFLKLLDSNDVEYLLIGSLAGARRIWQIWKVCRTKP